MCNNGEFRIKKKPEIAQKLIDKYLEGNYQAYLELKL
jgi:hypothetical protein